MSAGLDIQLRPAQRKILEYTRGWMGISAVPGSGKTWTLSLLAAQIIAQSHLRDDQEVLVVTLVNSAVENFNRRVGVFMQAIGLLPNLGYRVRTLHGLAHDIVRERPALVGLDENFQIVDERESESILNEAAQAWLHRHPEVMEDYLSPNLEQYQRAKVEREQLPKLVYDMAVAFIRTAKDAQLTPDLLRKRLDSLPVARPLAEMGCAIYSDYQRALNYRASVDFDDLIRLALQALETNSGYLERLRERWPYILEDEAQDSSRLQEQILCLLAGESPSQGNWVRVGDPNQAIFETFTTADPSYLRKFVRRPGVISRQLPNSGRSTASLIRLANRLVRWVEQEHPVAEVRSALSSPPLIEATPPGDPNPNPPDDPAQVKLVRRRHTPDEEIKAVVDSIQNWLPEHPGDTLAVLTPSNAYGFEVVNELRRRKLPYLDSLLRSSSQTRFSAGVLANLLAYLADPGAPGRLATAYEVWRRAEREQEEVWKQVKQVSALLRSLSQVEDFLYPGPSGDWLAGLVDSGLHPDVADKLHEFRELVRRWQSAVLLPVDQLVLTLTQDLLTDPSEIATGHKLAALLRQAAQNHPDWRLPELTSELKVIAKNERRFLGFSEEDTGFDPNSYRGQVVVATIHKAKGLEWDRVYLMSINDYDFPSALGGERYLSEKWFLRGHLNLQAEALAQLESLTSNDEYTWSEEGQATRQARLEYVRERLRLLYVGITRAKRELVITWNTGRFGNQQIAAPFLALLENDLT